MGQLKFRGRKVDITTFQMKGKDLRRLVGVCDCGQVVRGKEATPHPDPFAEEIKHDDTLVVQCKKCDHASMMEV